MSADTPDLAVKAAQGELMILGWRGGVDTKLQHPKLDGTLEYLAQWQGLRGEDLYIDTAGSRTLICKRTGTQITYSKDGKNYAPG